MNHEVEMRQRFSMRAPRAVKIRVQRRDEAGQQIGLVGLVLEQRAGQFAEKGRVNLLAAEILSAEVIQIRAVGQGILSDEINVPAVKILVLGRLAIVRNEAFAKNHVGGTKTAGIGAAKQDRVLGPFRDK